MHMNLSSSHLKRYKEIAKIFWKYGRSDLVRHMGSRDEIDSEDLKSAVHSASASLTLSRRVLTRPESSMACSS